MRRQEDQVLKLDQPNNRFRAYDIRIGGQIQLQKSPGLKGLSKYQDEQNKQVYFLLRNEEKTTISQYVKQESNGNFQLKSKL